ncbi:aspartyl-tRNA(Asn)/glutamyl-tRNA(Gln) amidotransferase subunit A [Erwinia toletana]|uniref:Aspartyl-tRNA(Asn)/glutamyl-tRNA(Gln) amidotransferase subunit A n=1 Tax=Winslowiella toletana TaxID=92490 RepID=A0ABS4PFH1_9GAMM|nr:amidase [Winslowiella toletana]MBP2171394.1 aspartyl-tRNA(Asn)/glutamyl-tRNA(Gln) amidotransferase subunit A [Winslowiella toletana]
MSLTEKTDLGEMTAAELSALFASGKASPVEAAQAALDRIERFNPQVNAFAYVVPELALAEAKASEARWQKDQQLSPLDGAPTTIKELTPVKGIPWRRGSALGSTQPSEKEFLIMQRLRAAGVTILGTTASPEFGWKGVTHGPAFGNTLNPWRTDRASGGSSGGAAVAAALNMGVLHEGSDGAGSIRIPASFCGIFGIKPTYGWIPADTVTPLMELAHRGPLTRTVEDAALFLNATTGPTASARYGSCPDQVPDWVAAIKNASVKGMRIGYSRNLGFASVQPDVAAAVERAARRLSEMGAIVEEVDPGFSDPQDAMLALWYAAEAYTLEQLKLTAQQKSLMDPGLLTICEKAKALGTRDYIAAEQVRADLKVTMAQFHEKYDALMLPTMPLTAFEAGVDFPGGEEGKDWSDWSPFTYPFNMTGQPAVSVSCGFDQSGLPVGLQFVGARYRDDIVLKLAAAYQAAWPEAFISTPLHQ